MNYFIKVKNQRGEDHLLEIDPTKMKLMQGADSTAIPDYKITSSTIDVQGPSEKREFNISIPSSSLSHSVVRTPLTSPKHLTSKPTVQDFDNRQAFHLIDTMTTSGLPFATIPSSLLHPNPMDDMEKQLPAKKLKTEASLPPTENASKESWTEAEIQLLLERRLSMNDKFENPNSRKTPYWN
ncbi:PREDICTED: uncharacterized protein LOC105567912 [Vollenhovia emeryi]|uniref:uncharacterized protein LOC105567912 n=1 Tax=Vollenhovia emeryi TaxID=411798 RepID=UPI0005F53E34|nr:PREDICTED: uncharacterized protein LOC105567912 [Vollenhovia emeryi]